MNQIYNSLYISCMMYAYMHMCRILISLIVSKRNVNFSSLLCCKELKILSYITFFVKCISDMKKLCGQINKACTFYINKLHMILVLKF